MHFLVTDISEIRTIDNRVYLTALIIEVPLYMTVVLGDCLIRISSFLCSSLVSHDRSKSIVITSSCFLHETDHY